MRKLLFLAPLVLVAALWLYGCDETPVDPVAAVAAETQEGTAPALKPDKPPPLPTPVMLSGWTLVELGPQLLQPGEVGSRFALCAEGKAVIAGGFWVYDATDYLLLSNGPVWFEGQSKNGWGVTLKNTGTVQLQHYAYAACVDASLDM